MDELKIVLTGSEGFLGRNISSFLEDLGHEIVRLDLSLGHDLCNETFVANWFKNNPSDALINCFAIDDPVGAASKNSNFLDISLESFARIMEVNSTSLFSVCREYIRNNSSGRIINFSSIYSIVSPRSDLYGAGEKHIAYGVSKSAVNQITRHLAVHTAPKFSINSIVLGGVLREQNSDFLEKYMSNVPMGRLAIPEDVHSVLEMLLSKRTSYITGSQLVVDGGWTLI